MCGGRDPFHRISVTDIEAANKRKDSSDGGAGMIHKILTWCGGYVIVRLPGDQAGRRESSGGRSGGSGRGSMYMAV